MIRDEVLPGITDYNNKYGGGQGLWEDSRLADLDPLIKKSQNQALGTANQLQGQLGNVMGHLEGFLDYDPNSPINQARRDSFNDQVLNSFETTFRPAIEDRGTFAGQFGGPQQQLTMGRAVGDLGRDMAEIEAGMMESDRTRAFQAMQMAPGLLATQLMPSQIMGDSYESP
jgi:hypothetical protein